jgi:hypothetical protein
MPVLVGTFRDVRSISEDPFLLPTADRAANTAPPTAAEIWRFWRRCLLRSTNTSISGFGDDTMQFCGQSTVTYVRAAFFGDAEALKSINDTRRAEYNPFTLPWRPQERYVSHLLNTQQRITDPEVVAAADKVLNAGVAAGAAAAKGAATSDPTASSAKKRSWWPW